MSTPRIAFVFPGQGAQSVGMGKALFETFPTAKSVFETFDVVTALNLSEVVFNGPAETLTQTLYTQPGILATSIAAFQVFAEHTGLMPTVAAGHSLGEYGALYAAGVISLEQAAQLIKQRASLMSDSPAGAMAAVLGLDAAKVNAVIEQYKLTHAKAKVCVANDNSPAQQVISGDKDAVEALVPLIKEAGAKRVIPLAVSGAFHSPLMSSAAQQFADFINDFEFQSAQFPVITNVDASLSTDADGFKTKLGQQIDHSVRWTETMQTMVDDAGINTLIEFGPGTVLTGLMKKTYPDVKVFNVSCPQTLNAAIEALKTPAAV